MNPLKDLTGIWTEDCGFVIDDEDIRVKLFSTQSLGNGGSMVYRIEEVLCDDDTFATAFVEVISTVLAGNNTELELKQVELMVIRGTDKFLEKIGNNVTTAMMLSLNENGMGACLVFHHDEDTLFDAIAPNPKRGWVFFYRNRHDIEQALTAYLRDKIGVGLLVDNTSHLIN